MKKIISLIIIGFVCGFLVITCPDAAEHKTQVSQVINDFVDDKIDNDEDTDNESPFTLIGKTIANNVVTALVDNNLIVDNYFVCSIGKVKWKGEYKTVSFGIMGHVLTFDKKQMKQVIDAIQNKDKQ